MNHHSIDAEIRKAVSIAAFQRDELFLRSPNLIPPSLRMLVEPASDAQRIETLIDDILQSCRDQESQNKECGTLERPDCDDETLFDAINGLTSTLEHCCQAGKNFASISASFPVQSDTGYLDRTINSMDINSVDLLPRVRKLHRITASSTTSKISVLKARDADISLDEIEKIVNKIESLRSVRWS